MKEIIKDVRAWTWTKKISSKHSLLTQASKNAPTTDEKKSGEQKEVVAMIKDAKREPFKHILRSPTKSYSAHKFDRNSFIDTETVSHTYKGTSQQENSAQGWRFDGAVTEVQSHDLICIQRSINDHGYESTEIVLYEGLAVPAPTTATFPFDEIEKVEVPFDELEEVVPSDEKEEAADQSIVLRKQPEKTVYQVGIFIFRDIVPWAILKVTAYCLFNGVSDQDMSVVPASKELIPLYPVLVVIMEHHQKSNGFNCASPCHLCQAHEALSVLTDIKVWASKTFLPK